MASVRGGPATALKGYKVRHCQCAHRASCSTGARSLLWPSLRIYTYKAKKNLTGDDVNIRAYVRVRPFTGWPPLHWLAHLIVLFHLLAPHLPLRYDTSVTPSSLVGTPSARRPPSNSGVGYLPSKGSIPFRCCAPRCRLAARETHDVRIVAPRPSRYPIRTHIRPMH